MNLLYTKKEVRKAFFKNSKKSVDNHTFYFVNFENS